MGFFQDHPPDNMIRIALLACTAALAAADADALYGIAGHHLGYGVGHVGYAAHHVAPVHHAVPAVHGAYAGAGRYVANSAGVVHVAKREAEADADAFYGAYGLGYAGLGYAGLGYGYRSYGYGYPYAYYGKRSA